MDYLSIGDIYIHDGVILEVNVVCNDFTMFHIVLPPSLTNFTEAIFVLWRFNYKYTL